MNKVFALPAVLAATVLLSACGGGGGGSSSSSSTSSAASNSSTSSTSSGNISGVAAAGAPLVGTVTVKDSLGATRTTTIAASANGAYSVDVSGMTAPFVFRAEGTANGMTYSIYSAATSADLNSTINITPLTDLVVDNIAGQLAKNYFDSGNFSGMNKSDLDAEAAKLKAKLLPVLQALGVDSSIDLLRTQFTPLSSALDKALDLIQVSVDSSTHLATITNVVTQQSIQDDIAVKAAAETSPPTLTDTSNMNTASIDVPLIKQALSDFSAKFATGLPAVGTLTPLMSSNFITGDASATDFATELASMDILIGSSFTDALIKQIDYSKTNPVANVDFTIKLKNGSELGRLTSWKLKKESGVWKLHGDQRVIAVSSYTHSTLSQINSTTCMMSGLEFDIQDNDSSNNGGTIAYALVTGPGLPSGGIRYNYASSGGYWNFDSSVSGQNGNYYVMSSTCGSTGTSTDTIQAIPDSAVYRITFYTAANAVVSVGSNGYYTETRPRRPLLGSELSASLFPTITAPTDLSTYTSGSLSITATGSNPAFSTWIYLAEDTTSGDYRSAEKDVITAANGGISDSLSLIAPTNGDTITWRTIRVESQDAYRRNFQRSWGVGTWKAGY